MKAKTISKQNAYLTTRPDLTAKPTMICSECGKTISPGNYAVYGSVSKRLCYECCADFDRESMVSYGTSTGLPLYLGEHPTHDEFGLHRFKVTNWCGTLSFDVHRFKAGGHNLAGSRVDVWFWGPDGSVWWGKCLAGTGGIVHCRRTNLVG